MIRKCVICGIDFKCSPSDKKVTCSTACKSKRTSQTHKGKKYPWSKEAKKKLSEKGVTENLKLGTLSAIKSPNSGRFESNVNAKSWEIISPDGEVFKIRNLANWCRENCHLFGKEPCDKSASQIAHGFFSIKKNMIKGKGVITYMGWYIGKL
jgi:hypothetical protein